MLGYVDSKNLLCKALENDKFSLKEKGLVKTIPMIPDSLSLSEALDTFKKQGRDFAAVVNEYALTVGIITLGDVMSTVMGSLVKQRRTHTLFSVMTVRGCWTVQLRLRMWSGL